MAIIFSNGFAIGTIPSGGVANAKVLSYNISNGSYNATSTLIDLLGHVNADIIGFPVVFGGDVCHDMIELNGTNQYIETQDITSYFDPNKGHVSIFTWVNLLGNGVVVDENGGNAGWYDANIECVNGTLLFSVWPYSSSITSSIATPFNHWYYIGYTYNSDSKVLTAYVNGQNAGSISIVRQVPYQYNFPYRFGIGKSDRTNMGDGGYSNLKFGTLEVWNYPLTSNEITTNYNNSVNTWIC